MKIDVVFACLPLNSGLFSFGGHFSYFETSQKSAAYRNGACFPRKFTQTTANGERIRSTFGQFVLDQPRSGSH